MKVSPSLSFLWQNTSLLSVLWSFERTSQPGLLEFSEAQLFREASSDQESSEDEEAVEETEALEEEREDDRDILFTSDIALS